VPETGPDGSEATRGPRTLLKIHEVAAAWSASSSDPGGWRAPPANRGPRRDGRDIETLGLGYAPPSRDLLLGHLRAQGFQAPLLLRSGLVLERDNARWSIASATPDHPIARDSGSIVAFAGRSMEADQVPKYLNSPETPIYSKGRTLYGLITPSAAPEVRLRGLVEGYFDSRRCCRSAGCRSWPRAGTASRRNSQLLRRFVSKVVLSFDPTPRPDGGGALVRPVVSEASR